MNISDQNQKENFVDFIIVIEELGCQREKKQRGRRACRRTHKEEGKKKTSCEGRKYIAISCCKQPRIEVRQENSLGEQRDQCIFKDMK